MTELEERRSRCARVIEEDVFHRTEPRLQCLLDDIVEDVVAIEVERRERALSWP